MVKSRGNRLAVFLATSGHSGVDRVMKNLIVEISGRGFSVDLLRIENHGPYLESAEKNIRVVDLGTAHVTSSFPKVVSYLRKEQPQALLADKDRVNRVALWANRLAGEQTKLAVRIGTTVTENLAKRGWLNRHLQYYSMRHFYSWANAVIVPSEGVAEDLASISRLPPERIKVLPSPVVTGELVELASKPIAHPWFNSEAPPIILAAGELCERKDFATLIRAFAKVRQQRPSKLVILGEGRQRAYLTALTRELGIESEVSLPGFVANPYAYMDKAALFTLSSRCEGSPVVLMEALAVGVPVVSTDCPSGPREILQGGRFGPLVPVADVDALAHAIVSTLDNPLDANVLRSAAEPYSVERSADFYLAAMGLG